MADSASLTVRLAADIANFQAGMKEAGGHLQEFSSKLDSIGGVVSGFINKLPLIGGAIGGAFAVGHMIEGAAEAERSVAKLEAVLKSAGLAGTGAAKDLEAFASASAKTSMFSGGQIRSSETEPASMGLSPETIKAAIKNAMDLATVMGDDLTSAAKKVGRALEDPTEGLARLGREGVIFSAAQKKLIEGFEETNQHAKAQQVILDELHKRFGGAAAADADTFSGHMKRISGDVEALGKNFGKLLKPIADLGLMLAGAVLEPLNKVIGALGDGVEKTMKWAGLIKNTEDELQKMVKAQEQAKRETEAHAKKMEEFETHAKTSVMEIEKMTKAATTIDFGDFGSSKFKSLSKDIETATDKYKELLNEWSKGGGDSESFVKNVHKIRSEIDRLKEALSVQGDRDFQNMHIADAEKMQDAAAAIRNSLETPLEHFEKEMGKLQMLQSSGLLDSGTVSRGMHKAFDALASAAHVSEPEPIRALAEGTAEAYAQAFRNTQQENPLLDAARRQVEQNDESNNLLQSIQQALGGQGAIGSGAGGVSITEVSM